MTGSDTVLNAETQRALRRRVRQLKIAAVGGLTAIVLLGVAGLSAMSSVPWQLSVVVTVGITVAVPVAVLYAMLRVLGLSHRDAIFVGKRACREGVAEAIALSGTGRTADVFTEPETAGDAESGDAEGEKGGEESGEEAGEESGEESDTLPPEQVAADANITESEPTNLHQQTEPQPES